MKPILALLALLVQAESSPPDSITAASLRGHVSFLASDLLEGRDTPSRGLDIAADYIASEFRRSNLESPPGGDYFQTAEYLQVTESPDPPRFNMSGANEVSPERIGIATTRGAHITNEQVFKWAPGVKIDVSLAGKVLMLRAPADPAVVGKLGFSAPDAIVDIVRGADEKTAATRLIPAEQNLATGPLVISVPALDVESAFDRLPVGLTSARASLTVSAPPARPVVLRNVIGILRGSDPELRNQYLLVSAHYDHLGKTDSGEIYNGANDDASGVATVIELANALARENPHPRRTIVFMCFFGEEKGLFGSAWYVRHPIVPLAQTIADLNFEQLGEPEKSEGLPASSLGVTGFDYSDIPETMAPDLKAAGVTLRQVRHNGEFFERSDNQSFAEVGVPAHTFVAALEYPDYHRTTDKWPKLNYENMAKLDRGLAVAIVDLANRAAPPHWNAESKKARDFRNAWRAMHP